MGSAASSTQSSSSRLGFGAIERPSPLTCPDSPCAGAPGDHHMPLHALQKRRFARLIPTVVISFMAVVDTRTRCDGFRHLS